MYCEAFHYTRIPKENKRIPKTKENGLALVVSKCERE
jgi:hypothetical protein